jgi:uncharacterized membrane protein
MNNPDDETAAREHATRGLVSGLAAYALWGVLPVYFKALENIAATDIVAHRIIWSLPFLAALILIGGQRQAVRAALHNLRAMKILALTATLIGVNWLLYVYAVTSGHILAAVSVITSIRSRTCCSGGSSSRSGWRRHNGQRSRSPRSASWPLPREHSGSCGSA